MGTERDLLFSGPCPCGRGELHVDHCAKDHPWADPDAFWYEGSVQCETCRPKFELRKVGAKFGLFDRSVALRNDKRSREAYARRNEVIEGEKAQGYLKRLGELLDQQSSHAATHRLLEGAGFYVSNIAKFRKDWRGGADWVRGQGRNMPLVLKALKVKDDELLEQIEKAGQHEVEPDEMIGEAVYTLPKDA